MGSFHLSLNIYHCSIFNVWSTLSSVFNILILTGSMSNNHWTKLDGYFSAKYLQTLSKLIYIFPKDESLMIKVLCKEN